MSDPGQWLIDLRASGTRAAVEGVLPVEGYQKDSRRPEEAAIMEKAEEYGATAVFFEAGRDGRPSIAQAFIFVSDGPAVDSSFAELHRRLWSWGGVPLVYRVTSGLVQLFRCAHKADFESRGKIAFRPYKTFPFPTLKLAAQIAADPWWDAERLRNGTLWDDPEVCKNLLSGNQAAQKTLIEEVKLLYDDLNEEEILPKRLRRRLLILSLLIAYLEARQVFEPGFFGDFKPGATKFFQVLSEPPALVALLEHLEKRFNGHVFALKKEDRDALLASTRLERFSRLVEAKKEKTGQLTLWERYSFADLPIELISHVYQLFVGDKATAVYTPPFLVRLMLAEVLSWERLDRVDRENEIILDPCCGSGVFLVEAYKRLVLHWRSRHDWKRPTIPTLQRLLKRVHGVDKEEGAVELAAFSLCLALCDALKPEEIRSSCRAFPLLKEKSILTGCFFEGKEEGKLKKNVGVIVGNPPFSSSPGTPGAERSYERYQKEHGALPDGQLAYLFLHESMELLSKGGVLSMLQEYNFLYNQQSLRFRQRFLERWDVREILDFISVRGLFKKGGADTKVVVVVAEADNPPVERQILHATFRRSGRTDAGQGFDIDYYDLYNVPRNLALANDGVWRSDLLGGGRVLGFVDRLKKYRTLGQLADKARWDLGEGWIFGDVNDGHPAEHVVGKQCVQAATFHDAELNAASFGKVREGPMQWPRRPEIFTPPLLLIHKHEDLSFGTWSRSYLTYQHTVLGISAASGDQDGLKSAAAWLGSQKRALQAFVAGSGTSGFASRATAVLSVDILRLPFPEDWDLCMSQHEQILVDDIVDYYRDLIRLGEGSRAMKEPGCAALPSFNAVYTQQINSVYKKDCLRPLDRQVWTGVICQPFIFGKGKVDWNGADELKDRLHKLLWDQRGGGLTVTRIARIYDGPCIYLIKPDRLRYWLPSVALRDADETLAELWEQGF